MFAVESLIDAPLFLFGVFAIQGYMEEAVVIAFEMAVELGVHGGRGLTFGTDYGLRFYLDNDLCVVVIIGIGRRRVVGIGRRRSIRVGEIALFADPFEDDFTIPAVACARKSNYILIIQLDNAQFGPSWAWGSSLDIDCQNIIHHISAADCTIDADARSP